MFVIRSPLSLLSCIIGNFISSSLLHSLNLSILVTSSSSEYSFMCLSDDSVPWIITPISFSSFFSFLFLLPFCTFTKVSFYFFLLPTCGLFWHWISVSIFGFMHISCQYDFLTPCSHFYSLLFSVFLYHQETGLNNYLMITVISFTFIWSLIGAKTDPCSTPFVTLL